MAKKTAIDAPRENMFRVEPEKMVLVTDENHPLYDPRVHLPLRENLVLNIMAHGVKEPILIRKNGDTFEVVDGRQRVKHAIEANKRLNEIKNAQRLFYDGYEFRAISCQVERNYNTKIFTLTRLDTGEVVETRPLRPSELQRRLLLEGQAKAREEEAAAHV